MKHDGHRWNRAGAIAYVLWGVLHIVVGVIPVLTFFGAGPAEMLAALPGASQVPANVDEPLLQAAYFTAEHHFNLAAFGVLAILVAVRLNWHGDPFGFRLNLIVLGLVDVAFIVGQILPGYMPLLMGASGPLLYVLGALFTALGLRAGRAAGRAEAVSGATATP